MTLLPFPAGIGILKPRLNSAGGGRIMLNQAFNEVYTKFKLHFYQEIFRRFQDREASLTTVETFCMESIMALGRPSVNEFATFMRISPPNAAYKVNSLVKKAISARYSPRRTAGNIIWRSHRSILTTTTFPRPIWRRSCTASCTAFRRRTAPSWRRY